MRRPPRSTPARPPDSAIGLVDIPDRGRLTPRRQRPVQPKHRPERRAPNSVRRCSGARECRRSRAVRAAIIGRSYRTRRRRCSVRVVRRRRTRSSLQTMLLSDRPARSGRRRIRRSGVDGTAGWLCRRRAGQDLCSVARAAFLAGRAEAGARRWWRWSGRESTVWQRRWVDRLELADRVNGLRSTRRQLALARRRS